MENPKNSGFLRHATVSRLNQGHDQLGKPPEISAIKAELKLVLKSLWFFISKWGEMNSFNLFCVFIAGLQLGSASHQPYCEGAAKCVYRCQTDGTCDYKWSMESIDSRCDRPANNCYKDCRDICNNPYNDYAGKIVTVLYNYGKCYIYYYQSICYYLIFKFWTIL